MQKTVTMIFGALLIIFAIAGIADAGYLTWEHYQGIIPPCGTGIFADCGTVLRSSYSSLFGVPLALLGLIHYSLEFMVVSFAFLTKKRWARVLSIFLATAGFIMSLYFVFLMVFVIAALCKYCLLSAIISTFLFVSANIAYPNDRRYLVSKVLAYLYKHIAKPVFFRIDPELVHVGMVGFGKLLGNIPLVRYVANWLLRVKDERLSQTVSGIRFENPVGLAAGFDYEANLTQMLAPIGFGFQSVGSITNHPYEGNPRPMLGRLPKSKSLMVNKGFKNLGAEVTVKKLSGKTFSVPVGVSIGRTNGRKDLDTQEKSIVDIISAFKTFEKSSAKFSYYELNISCPNLFGTVSFYTPKHLEDLLKAVGKLKLSRPVFIKMPIDKTDKEIIAMLDVIARHSPAGVIFGNLSTNRKNSALVQSEVKQFPIGNFSGKPTYTRSNELISLAYKTYGKRLVIIGCGGIFSARDAYEKIRRGATILQLITGMIYQGPQLISEINNGLLDLLERDGFTHVSEVVGSKNR